LSLKNFETAPVPAKMSVIVRTFLVQQLTTFRILSSIKVLLPMYLIICFFNYGTKITKIRQFAKFIFTIAWL
ncbi:MAG: hypothetical protein PUH66_09540, partial [Bacteroidales bacterium]|nr:hypothetical protein [Bacteroidales bacterium]